MVSYSFQNFEKIRGTVKKSLQSPLFSLHAGCTYTELSLSIEPLSFIPLLMDSDARMVALRHQHTDDAFWTLPGTELLN